MIRRINTPGQNVISRNVLSPTPFSQSARMTRSYSDHSYEGSLYFEASRDPYKTIPNNSPSKNSDFTIDSETNNSSLHLAVINNDINTLIMRLF